MVDSGSDSYEESRCKFYGTTIYSCTCKGYGFRRTCRHVEFMRRKLVDGHTDEDNSEDVYNEALVSIGKGVEAVPFIEKYGERMVKKMKIMGDIWERHGVLYKLE